MSGLFVSQPPFPISGLARLREKPRLCRSSWRAFASTHPLMLPSTSSREALVACPPWKMPSFRVESTLSSPCSRSDPPSLATVRLSPTFTLSPLMILCFGQTALFLFLLARAAPAFLPIALSVATLSFSAGPVCSSFSAETCAILHALCWSRQHQQVCHFSSLILLSDSRSVLSSIFPLISNSVADLAGTVFSYLFYQATMGHRTLISTGKRCGR